MRIRNDGYDLHVGINRKSRNIMLSWSDSDDSNWKDMEITASQALALAEQLIMEAKSELT